MFEKIDSSGDGKLSLFEFQNSLEMLRTWGMVIDEKE